MFGLPRLRDRGPQRRLFPHVVNLAILRYLPMPLKLHRYAEGRV